MSGSTARRTAKRAPAITRPYGSNFAINQNAAPISFARRARWRHPRRRPPRLPRRRASHLPSHFQSQIVGSEGRRRIEDRPRRVRRCPHDWVKHVCVPDFWTLCFCCLRRAPPAREDLSGDKGLTTYAIAMHGQPTLPADFSGLPYADPQATKGGHLALAYQGTFDSLNPYNLSAGSTAQGLIGNVFQSLMLRSLDEPFTLYGLIAQSDRDRRRPFLRHLPPRRAGAVFGRRTGERSRRAVHLRSPQAEGSAAAA